jgi:plasmid stabilization system protein ParE
VPPLELAPKASDDIADGWSWYEDQSHGLGDEFVRAVGEALRRVQRTPSIFPIVNHRIRRASVRRFPYGVYFEMAAELILVIGVLHASRDPETWQRRAR